jgi:demethylmenaquinone methyltransferase/2-methoxy-6-polyprenyl-1,4-benzoquinol methylase
LEHTLTTQIKPDKHSDLPKKQQVEQMFDSIAPKYDFLNHFLSAGIDNLWRKRAINTLLTKKPKYILDMATGTGDLAFEALKRLNPDKIVGLDISEGMLSYARKKAKHRGIEIISFERGDSENINYNENTFDAVTVAFGVRNFENLNMGLKELQRVLKPGGSVVVLEFSKPQNFPVKEIYNFYFAKILPLWGKIISKDNQAYTYLPESVMAFPEGRDFLLRLEQAGFKETKAKKLTFGICSLYTAIK